MQIIYDSLLRIPREYERFIKPDMEVMNPQYLNNIKMGRSTEGIKDTLRFYNLTPTHIEVPREYRNSIIPEDLIVDKRLWNNPRDHLEFTGQLRDNQKDALKYLTKMGGNKIIEMPTGSGKTVSGMSVITHYKRRTLVLVHKKLFLEMWKTEAETFTNARVGIVGNGKFQIGNCYDIVVATVQGLSPRYEKKFKQMIDTGFFNSFDIVIADEAHNFSAETFHKALSLFPAKIRVGYTATGFRNDTLDFVFKTAIGDVYSIETEQTIKPRIWECETGWTDNTHGFNTWAQNNAALLRNRMVKDKSRNIILFKAINSLIKADRKILFLSDRVAHCEYFYNRFKEKYPSKSIGLMVSKSKMSLDEAKNHDVIFATYQMAKEGLNLPILDTVIYGTPLTSKNKSGIIQSIGRLTRSTEGKKGADVYDFVDSGYKYKNMFYGRRKIYFSMGLEVIKMDMRKIGWRNG